MSRRGQTVAAGLLAVALTCAGELTAVAVGGLERAPDRGSERLDRASDGEGCTELVAMFEAHSRFYAASLDNDADVAAETLGELATLADAAVAAAPDGIADAIAAWGRPWQTAEADLAGIDLTDVQTVFATLSYNIWFDPAADAAAVVVERLGHACDYSGDDTFLAPDPPAPCEELDASIAAGMVFDPSELDGTATQFGPGLSWSLCTYDHGSASLYTMSFNSLDLALRVVSEGTVDWGGNIVDADVGVLPDSTMVTQLWGATTVTVFEAPVAFAIQLNGSDVTPTDVVDAAEELLDAQHATSIPPTVQDLMTGSET